MAMAPRPHGYNIISVSFFVSLPIYIYIYRSEGLPLRDILSLSTLAGGVGLAGIVPPPSSTSSSPPSSPGEGGSQIDGKIVFSEWVFLAGKIILDPVGVFCGILGGPSGHMGPKSIFV